MKPTLGLAFSLLLLWTGSGVIGTPSRAGDDPLPALRVLIAGSGPDLAHNQVAIESNVRYVARLLPPGATARVLFADGNPQAKDVLYEDKNGGSRYRAPRLPSLDAPNRLRDFDSQARALTLGRPAPLLLYFTGHGSPSPAGDDADNSYDMWGGDDLSVRHLAGVLNRIPPAVPVTVIMVQCFSGSFGNLLFQNADPHAPLAPRHLCGFFASVAQWPAAGCTPNVNEADYHDFTGYFFAALSGTDRLGRPVTGADYDGDGRVGMNEAFAYALIHDDSIDTPVCTSDVFLRRFVKTPEADVFQVPFSQVCRWAGRAQLAALRGLSDALKLSGEGRTASAYRRFRKTEIDSDDLQDVRRLRFVRLVKSVVLAHTLEASSDEALKRRFAALLALEAGNPLRPLSH